MVRRTACLLILSLCFTTFAMSGVWAQTLDISAWYAEPRYTHFTGALESAAAELLPGVPLSFRPRPANDALLTMLASGTLPDVVTVHHSDNFPHLVDQHALLPLDSYIEKDGAELWRVVPPELLAPFQRNGQLYAIPAIAELNNVYVNLTMLAEAGLAPPDWNWTWDDLQSMARLLTRDVNGDGIPDTYGASVRQFEQEIGGFIYANGGSYMNAQAAGTEVTIDSPGTIEALEFVRSLIHDFRVAVPTWERDRWDAGRLGFFFTGSWNVGTFQQAIGDSFAWDYIPYPRSPTTGQRASRLSVIGISVPATTAHPEEAARFAQLAAATRVQEAFLEARLSPVPARLDLFDSPFMLSGDAAPRSAARTIMETLTQGEAVAETVYPVPQMQAIALEHIASVMVQGASPYTAMPEAARLMRALLP